MWGVDDIRPWRDAWTKKIREAFDAFARARIPALLRFGYALTGSTSSAADLVQEALARMGARWAQIAHDGGDPEPYARKVMANTWVRRLGAAVAALLTVPASSFRCWSPLPRPNCRCPGPHEEAQGSAFMNYELAGATS